MIRVATKIHYDIIAALPARDIYVADDSMSLQKLCRSIAMLHIVLTYLYAVAGMKLWVLDDLVPEPDRRLAHAELELPEHILSQVNNVEAVLLGQARGPRKRTRRHVDGYRSTAPTLAIHLTLKSWELSEHLLERGRIAQEHLPHVPIIDCELTCRFSSGTTTSVPGFARS